MSQKRVSEEGRENSSSPEEKRRRVPALKSVFAEYMKVHAIQKFFSALEPLLRKVVKEEVERALEKHFTSKPRPYNQIHPSSSRSLQLQFTNKLSLPIFTGTRIEGEDSPAVTVALVDALTGQPVVSGPESLMKVEIVVLEGDFEGDEEDWTWKEFKNNVVREREGKRSLLLGDAFLNLSEGTAAMGELVFTDNSSWTRSRKFRLGARVETGYFDGMRVREAKTESFMVKDHRGELYKKHYPPSLLDEVWRLEKIGKDGAFHKRLNRGSVHTVKDFLTLLHRDAPRLRNILGNGMSAKMWEVTVDHARTCELNGQLYVYNYPPAQDRMGLVFNVISEPVGMLSERQYIPMHDISETQKEDVQNLVKIAYEHWEDVVPYNSGAVSDSSLQLPTTLTGADNPCSSFSDYHKLGGFDFIQSSESSTEIAPSILSVGGTRSLDYPLGFGFNSDSHGGVHIDDLYRNPELELVRITNSLIRGAEHDTRPLCGQDRSQYFDVASSSLLQSESMNVLESQSELENLVSSFLAKSVPSHDKSHAKACISWMTLRYVFRWKFSIRRIVASKKGK